MRVLSIQIKNVLGLRSLDMRPGRITVIAGKNGLGKTSALNSIRLLFEGSGKDLPAPVNLHSIAGRGEIVAELDEFVMTRTFTEGGDYLKIKDASGKEMPAAKTFIKNLLGKWAFNPLEWCFLSDKEKREALLKVVDVTLTEDDVHGVLPPGLSLPAVDWKRPALEVIENLTAHFYALRHAKNQDITKLKKTVEELSGDVPGDFVPPDPKVKAGLLEELSQAQTKARAREEKISALGSAKAELEKCSGWVKHCEDQKAASQKYLTENPAADLAPLLEEEARLLKSLEDARKKITEGKARNTERTAQVARETEAVKNLKTYQDAQTLWTSEVAKIEGEAQSIPIPNTDAISARLAELDKIAPLENTWRQVQTKQSELYNLTSEWEILDKSVKTLQTDLPSEVLRRGNLPITGLLLDGGRILMQGVPVSQMSGREQLLLALEIAKALNKRLGIICIDGIEALDQESFDAFVKATELDGFQYFVSRVANSDKLQIETINGEE